MATDKRCVIIGASHSGVTCAFALRKEGYKGEILLIDSDSHLPYHRPPLSKTFLTEEGGEEKYLLKSKESYEKEEIELKLGAKVVDVDAQNRFITFEDNTKIDYNQLVLATGASAFYPPIEGLSEADNLFVLRSAKDVIAIKKYFLQTSKKRVLIIGGGYIGLEIAASFRKLNAEVTILERENRVLSRVTSPEMSTYFQDLHHRNGVKLELGKNVQSLVSDETSTIICSEGSSYEADLLILGVGIKVNIELAQKAKLKINNGILVDQQCRTSDEYILAIGDCTQHFNPHYKKHIRLESVQNANEQAKVVAANICGRELIYDSIPWFWSDQYDVKLQMVGLSDGYDESIMRIEPDGKKRSNWYFKKEELLAVDAVNNPKAYVLGTKFIKNKVQVDKSKLKDNQIDIKKVAE